MRTKKTELIISDSGVTSSTCSAILESSFLSFTYFSEACFKKMTKLFSITELFACYENVNSD